MDKYKGLKVFYGDLHNHCAISYGHGPLEAALGNAQTQLDFCSVTGHAAWPDMPEPDGRIDYIIDFHKDGFAKLAKVWPDVLATMRAHNRPGEFLVFPGYEIHSNQDGDRTFIFRELAGELILGKDIPDTIAQLLQKYREDVLGFPHHLGYPQGHRGVNWSTYNQDFCPLVEIFSMHGCAEGGETIWPFLHSMGPFDGHSAMQHGLGLGYRFGLIANTDHHSAFPGSYGRGRTAVWAPGLSRADLWQALRTRRTYALTGDRIELRFAINGALMGENAPPAEHREVKIGVSAGNSINHIDLIKNNRLLKRFVPADNTYKSSAATIGHTKLYLEVGWGEKHKITPWEVELMATGGQILSVEPRFRGMEVVSPVELGENQLPYRNGEWKMVDPKAVWFKVQSQGNPTNTTPTTQGLCLDVILEPGAQIRANINGHILSLPIERLVEGQYARPLGTIDSPAYCFHQLPREQEFKWDLRMTDEQTSAHDVYYVRVVQDNGQMAWSSPIYF
jgi:hypothetical protein